MTTKHPYHYCDVIMELCIERGTSIHKLAQKAGVCKQTIYHWNTHAPMLLQAAAVAKALGVTVDDIIKREEELSNHV